MSDIAFLAGILLLFAGVEVHAVHAPELAKPQTQFPRAMFLAALISFGLFTLGALAVAIITPTTRSTSSRGCSPPSRSLSNVTTWDGSRTSWDCSWPSVRWRA